MPHQQCRLLCLQLAAASLLLLSTEAGPAARVLADGEGQPARDVDESSRLGAMRQDLAAYYPFDETFKDAAGMNPDALPRGSAKISATDTFAGGGAAELGGAAAGKGYLVIPAPNAMKFDKAFTLAGWCRAYGVSNGTEIMGTLAGKDGRGFVFTMRSNGNWGFHCRNAAGQQVLDQVHFDWAYRKYKAQTWCFFAFVVEETAAGRTLVCYGNAAGQGELKRSSSALTVKGDLGGGAFYLARTAPATFDELTVWNRALSADEVAFLFNKGRGFDCHKLLAPAATQPAASSQAAASRPAEPPQVQAIIDQINATDQPGEAMTLFNRGRAIGKNSAALRRAYMLKMLALGLPRLAHLAAAELVRIEPSNGTAWSVVAYYRLAKEGKYSQALDPAVRAAALAPSDASALSNLGALMAVCETMKLTVPMTPEAAKLLRDNEAMWKLEPPFAQAYQQTLDLFKKGLADADSLNTIVTAREKEIESLSAEVKLCQTTAAANAEKIVTLRTDAKRWTAEYDKVRSREQREGQTKPLEEYRRYVEAKYRGVATTIDALLKQNAELAGKVRDAAKRYEIAKAGLAEAKAALTKPTAPKIAWKPPCINAQPVADREIDGPLRLAAPAAPASQGDDSPEAKAAAALRVAELFLANNRKPQAMQSLREIIEQYPDTPAARQAADLLRRHGP
ncbi:MAG: LamG-like jellyroll fold domain-containing protein [Planctomycetaceae bacterium]|nr:LamG domain-containing protein [Planctomycetaceae bacterium]